MKQNEKYMLKMSNIHIIGVSKLEMTGNAAEATFK